MSSKRRSTQWKLSLVYLQVFKLPVLILTLTTLKMKFRRVSKQSKITIKNISVSVQVRFTWCCGARKWATLSTSLTRHSLNTRRDLKPKVRFSVLQKRKPILWAIFCRREMDRPGHPSPADQPTAVQVDGHHDWLWPEEICGRLQSVWGDNNWIRRDGGAIYAGVVTLYNIHVMHYNTYNEHHWTADNEGSPQIQASLMSDYRLVLEMDIFWRWVGSTVLRPH